jgi:hypothetical protein
MFDETSKKTTIRIGFDPRMVELVQRLSAIGGTKAIFNSYSPEPDIDDLLNRGRHFPGADHQQVADGPADGWPLGCGKCRNRTIAISYICGMGAVQIVTGCALLPDGAWYRHYWTIDPDGQIEETTEPGRDYYGFVLDDIQTLNFLMRSLPLEMLPRKSVRLILGFLQHLNFLILNLPLGMLPRKWVKLILGFLRHIFVAELDEIDGDIEELAETDGRGAQLRL